METNTICEHHLGVMKISDRHKKNLYIYSVCVYVEATCVGYIVHVPAPPTGTSFNPILFKEIRNAKEILDCFCVIAIPKNVYFMIFQVTDDDHHKSNHFIETKKCCSFKFVTFRCLWTNKLTGFFVLYI